MDIADSIDPDQNSLRKNQFDVNCPLICEQPFFEDTLTVATNKTKWSNMTSSYPTGVYAICI